MINYNNIRSSNNMHTKKCSLKLTRSWFIQKDYIGHAQQLHCYG